MFGKDMMRFLRDHWPFAIFASLLCAYLFITSGLAGLMLANFPGQDRTSYPGLLGNTIAFILGGLILSGIRLFYPMALHAGEFQHGTYAIVQLPLVLGIVVVAMILEITRRKRIRTVAITALLCYMAAMLLTNDLAFAFRVDHSKDFPIGSALNGLDWRDKPTEEDVRRVAGVPIAESTFSSVDIVLPRYVRESMVYWKQDEAYILAYSETDKWGRESTYYVMFNPDTKQRFSMVTINTPIPQNEWPNKAVDSTATRVTPPADPSLRSRQESRHGQP